MNYKWKEKDLENFVANNMAALERVIRWGECDGRLKLLGTQIRCRYGVIDMLCHIRNCLIVVEFKAGTADESTVGQINRYVQAISHVNFYEYLTPDEFRIFGADLEWEVQTVLVAPQITRQAAISVAWPVLATPLDNGQFDLRCSWAIKQYPKDDNHISQVLRPFAKLLRDIAAEDVQQRAESTRQGDIEFLLNCRN